MAVADNTRMKGMEADIKKLFQMFESISEETRAEHARSSEATNLKIDALQQSITQLLHAQPHPRSELHELSHGSNSGSKFHQRPFMQPRRVGFDLPKFDGSDALGWIFFLNQYFDYFRVPEEDQISIAAIHMTGAAILWFQMSQRAARFCSWNQLKCAIELEFGPSLYESPRELLFKLQQLGTVSDYYNEFVALANRTQIDPPDALKDCFISGLKSNIRREVKAQCPPSLMRAVTLARLYEDKFSSVPRSTYGPASPRTQPTPTTAISSNRPIQRNTLSPLLPTPPKRPALPPMISSVRKLSPAEIQSKREKGLCYWCDEKFSATHRCPNRQYIQLQLVLDDADGGDTEMQESSESEPSLEALESQIVEHHLSYNAMHGTSGPALIRVNAIINGLEVQALIDGGSSDSFIQPRIAKFLNLPIEPALEFKVIVGSFEVLLVEGRIASLDVNLSGCLVSIPEVYVLHVAGGELTTILHFFASGIKGEFVTVQGYKSPPSSQAQFHHIRRLVSTDAVAAVFTLELQQLDGIVKPPLQLPEALHPALVSLIQKYAVVFEQPLGLPPRRSQDHGIPLIEGAAPVKSRPYRYPHNLKAQIETMVSEMLQEGIIQPSKSPFSSPILLVKKKDGTWHFCTDYRALNAITVKDCFPIPTVDELLDELFGATIFSKLDLRSGYHQILVKLEDRFKTAFRTHQGLYEWLVMPFGLTNAPATFQSLMNDIFKPYLRKFVLVFFYDILVYSSGFDLHLEHLELVLKLLQQESLFAKLSKCLFGSPEVDYLGHTIRGGGVHMETAKVQAILEWPQPASVKQLQGFLGLTGYYRRFIKGYASLAAPLTDLLKKDSFNWSEQATQAFRQLQHALCTKPVLALPNFSIPFEVETDASGTGVGAVLIQQKHHIAYFSKKLPPTLQKQSAYIREFYAITEALAKFRHYLLGKRFILRTDHQSLKALLEQDLHTPEQHKWLHKLLGFDFEIHYKAGTENVAADALSRSFFGAWSAPRVEWLDQLRAELVADEDLRVLLANATPIRLRI
ncbi:uncharacterized protein [Arachis hypogaea]|uniref:uncharacterized protein n=1 Tax=Arachis hypogaea TaxID=3818 RepID=UPI003B20DAA0